MKRDEAIAQAIRESNPGDSIEIHAEDCPLTLLRCVTEQDERTCQCKRLVIVVGASA